MIWRTWTIFHIDLRDTDMNKVRRTLAPIAALVTALTVAADLLKSAMKVSLGNWRGKIISTLFVSPRSAGFLVDAL